ncbi:MAG TPA: oligosaccharide flippase family protein [Burkholderiaceae bacterium]|jgi:O-antigen/teichoic acid export membrane protein|nr:oligosaccharide flippase family protein [Burkholderiaceae bacterium]
MKRNFLYTSVSIGSRLLVSFLLFLFLARLWGPTQFGLFAFVFSLAALLAVVVDFGFHVYLLREVAATPERASILIREALRTKVMLAAIAIVIGPFLVVAMGVSTLPPQLALPLFLAALLASFSDFFVAPLRALGLFDQEAIVVTLANLVQFTVAGTVAWNGGGVVMVAWAICASRGVYLLLAYGRLRTVCPLVRSQPTPELGPIATFRRVWTYGAEGALGTAWSQLDIVLVRALCGREAVGIYSAGQKIVGGIYAMAPVVGNVMIPRLSLLAFRRDQQFWRISKITVFAMGGIGLGFALPLIVLSDPIVHTLFGKQFQQMVYLLPIFGSILVIKYINGGIAIATVSAGLNNARILAPIIGMAVVGVLLVAQGDSALQVEKFMLIYIVGLLVTGCTHLAWLHRLYRRPANDGRRQ